jgi:hypothetical protein
MTQMLAYPQMKRLLAMLCACACTAVLAAPPAKEREQAVNVTLEPGKMHEECARVEAGDKRRYHWKSDVPVDFNIHYHQMTEVFYPIRRGGMRGDGGTFTAKTGEDYCWMWIARDKPAKIEGRIELK